MNDLTDWMRKRIERDGPVPFARFMEWALYHPQHGYYSAGRVRVGEDAGDFTTAPHISGVFTRCVARFAQALDEQLGLPEPFTVVEGGPGEGRFALDFLDALRDDHPPLYRRTRYFLDEASPVLRSRQQQMLGEHAERVFSGRPNAPIRGLYFSNELVDAFPAHRLLLHQGRLAEVHVDWDGETLREVLLPPSSQELVEACSRLPVGEDHQVEVRPAARRWLREVSTLLDRGCVLTVDYGDEPDRLFGPRYPEGTCVAYRRHSQHNDLLACPGEQDLTAQVDFGALTHAGESYGLRTAALLRQRDFLLATGLIEEVERLERTDLPEADKMLLRQNLAPLLMPGHGMGERFKVLVQTKDLVPDALPLRPEVPTPA